MTDLLERARGRHLPFADLMGVEYVEATPDRLVGRLTVRPELCTRGDMLHGGVVMAFADTLGATATALGLDEGFVTTTIESKTNFVGPARAGTTITGECTPVHRGRRTQVWQTRITNEDGRLVALVTQTQMVLEAR